MRIGLIRHFPVDQPLPAGWKTAAELADWRQRYDVANTLIGQADVGAGTWCMCLASDLPRTEATARAIFSGNIELTSLLREPEYTPFRTGRLRLPVWMWRWVLMLCWLTGHQSQRACRDDFRRRVQAAADRLCALNADTLVVSHAGMMAYLSAELKRRGFSGPKLRIAKHAKLYAYERKDGKSIESD